MMLEIFIFFELVMIGFFVSSFFTKQEIFWGITAILSGALMFTSYSIEYYVYFYNNTVGAYVPTMVSFSYPYLVGLNMIFFALTVLLGLFDLFDKYGDRISSGKP